MSSHSIFVAIWIPGLLLLIASSEGFCQLPTPDSTSASRDSGRVSSDTVGVSRPDSSLRDSAATADTNRIRSDTLRPYGNVGSVKSDTALVKAPRDSVLEKACGGTSTVARDLLVVIFAPEAGAQERAAVAKEVRGKLIGQVSATEPGAYYIRVPTDGNEFQLRAASDRLIQLPQVRQAGSRACPPPSPPKPSPTPQAPASARTDSQAPATPR
jgi:hypothetical protein